MSDDIDLDAVRRFWADRARHPSNRWTGEEMLAHDLALLGPLAAAASAVLDLGSGHGELSRTLCADGTRLVAVDWEEEFGRAFTGPNEEFRTGLVTEVALGERFDLVLLYGVVTSLDLAGEEAAYGVAGRHVADGGVVVVKNQCSTGEGFVVDGHSEALGRRYTGRYPSLEGQRDRLTGVFAEVEVVPYPSHLNPWPDSRHVAFVCRSPRRAATAPG